MKGNQKSAFDERAEGVRLRIYTTLGHGGIQRVANHINRHRSYVSAVLHGTVVSNPVLDDIELFLNEIERAEPQAA